MTPNLKIYLAKTKKRNRAILEARHVATHYCAECGTPMRGGFNEVCSTCIRRDDERGF